MNEMRTRKKTSKMKKKEILKNEQGYVNHSTQRREMEKTNKQTKIWRNNGQSFPFEAIYNSIDKRKLNESEAEETWRKWH